MNHSDGWLADQRKKLRVIPPPEERTQDVGIANQRFQRCLTRACLLLWVWRSMAARFPGVVKRVRAVPIANLRNEDGFAKGSSQGIQFRLLLSLPQGRHLAWVYPRGRINQGCIF